MSYRILIVDDEAGIRQALKQVLEYENLVVKVTASGGEALTVYPDFRPHLVFLDVKMAGLDGLETLTRLRSLDPNSQVVMISGHGTIATAVEATQRGAFDFLEKPLDTDRLLVTVRNALAQAKLMDENTRLREESESRFRMVGESPALKEVRDLVAKVGPTQLGRYRRYLCAFARHTRRGSRPRSRRKMCRIVRARATARAPSAPSDRGASPIPSRRAP